MKRLADLENEFMDMPGVVVRDFGEDMDTLLYLKWITNKDPLYSTGNSAHCSVAAWLEGEFEGQWIHVYVWSLHYSPETITTLFISYTPVQNKKFKRKKKIEA